MAEKLSPNSGLEGLRSGRLTIKKRVGRSDDGYDWLWLSVCDCGRKKKIRGRSLTKSNPTLSCGCLQKEQASDANRTHGGSGSPEYKVWSGMRTRCTNPKQASFKDYGKRGINVCERWKDFSKFLEDMGLRPTPKHTIERVDNDKGYGPDNCKWLPKKDQGKNKTTTQWVTYRKERRTLAEWCDLLDLPLTTIRMRLWRGWAVSEAFEFPITPGKWRKWHLKER
jgi:hypothetical protein